MSYLLIHHNQFMLNSAGHQSRQEAVKAVRLKHNKNPKTRNLKGKSCILVWCAVLINADFYHCHLSNPSKKKSAVAAVRLLTLLEMDH